MANVYDAFIPERFGRAENAEVETLGCNATFKTSSSSEPPLILRATPSHFYFIPRLLGSVRNIRLTIPVPVSLVDRKILHGRNLAGRANIRVFIRENNRAVYTRTSKFNFTSWLPAIAPLLRPSVEITGAGWLLKKFPSSAAVVCTYGAEQARYTLSFPPCLNGANRNGNNTPCPGRVSTLSPPLSRPTSTEETESNSWRKEKRTLFISPVPHSFLYVRRTKIHKFFPRSAAIEQKNREREGRLSKRARNRCLVGVMRRCKSQFSRKLIRY